MLFGELSHRDNAAALREKPFEGSAASQEHAPGDSFLFILHLFPELGDWLPLLQRLSLPPGDAAYLAALASRNGTDFQTELLASGLVDEDEFHRLLADEVGVGHAGPVDPDRLIISDDAAIAFLRSSAWHMPLRLAEKDGATSYLIVPSRTSPSQLHRLLARHPRIVGRLKFVAPGQLRAALLSRVRRRLAARSVSDLFDRFPDMSARIVANARQGLIVGALLVAFPAMAWVAPGGTWVTLHFLFSSFFLACIGLRFAAVVSAGRQRAPRAPSVLPADLPVYSVLVALYREAELVPELVAALERIDWPKSKLEIKLVCEADDHATLGAIRDLALPRNIEVIEVPVFGPRTKPKALAYALPLTSGAFVALYDAEDHPHPMQIVRAWQKFQETPSDVACIQAPLEITARGVGIVERMFAFEYAALFRGMLPWLSARRLLVPLGGTSNHFRRAALEEVGGWDPYNVTEDADLGMRLARFGYRTETIACPTYESGPDTYATWLPQRTRWFKGWMQTWLVHMRDPALLMRELGPASFVIGQILFAGMVLSALAHPFLLFSGVFLALDLALARPSATLKSALLTLDVVTIGCGYISFLLLGWQTLRLREKLGFWKLVLFTPVYWMMMSIAAWRAVWQLWRKPHLWEKTPHRPLRGGATPNVA